MKGVVKRKVLPTWLLFYFGNQPRGCRIRHSTSRVGFLLWFFSQRSLLQRTRHECPFGQPLASWLPQLHLRLISISLSLSRLFLASLLSSLQPTSFVRLFGRQPRFYLSLFWLRLSLVVRGGI